MDKQAHLRHRRSGEQKGTKRGLAGAGTPKCQAGWRAAECTECAAHPARLSLPGTQRGDTGDVPTASLCSPKARPHHPGFQCILCFICQLGLCAMPQWQGWWAVSVSVSASLLGKLWAFPWYCCWPEVVLGWMDRVWTNPRSAVSPIHSYSREETAPRHVPPIPLPSGEHWKSITRLEGGTRLPLTWIITCVHWPSVREWVRDRIMMDARNRRCI